MIDARSGDDSSAASVVDYKLQAWALLGDLASLAGDLSCVETTAAVGRFGPLADVGCSA